MSNFISRLRKPRFALRLEAANKIVDQHSRIKELEAENERLKRENLDFYKAGCDGIDKWAAWKERAADRIDELYRQIESWKVLADRMRLRAERAESKLRRIEELPNGAIKNMGVALEQYDCGWNDACRYLGRELRAILDE